MYLILSFRNCGEAILLLDITFLPTGNMVKYLQVRRYKELKAFAKELEYDQERNIESLLSHPPIVKKKSFLEKLFGKK